MQLSGIFEQQLIVVHAVLTYLAISKQIIFSFLLVRFLPVRIKVELDVEFLQHVKDKLDNLLSRVHLLQSVREVLNVVIKHVDQVTRLYSSQKLVMPLEAAVILLDILLFVGNLHSGQSCQPRQGKNIIQVYLIWHAETVVMSYFLHFHVQQL